MNDKKDILYISKDENNWEEVYAPDKNNFSFHLLVDNLTLNIISNKDSIFDLYINYKNFNVLQNLSLNKKNKNHNIVNDDEDINRPTAIFNNNYKNINQKNNYKDNNNNNINNYPQNINIINNIPDQKDLVAIENKNQSRNNKSNLKYQSSDELIEIAREKNRKSQSKHRGNDDNNYNSLNKSKQMNPSYPKNVLVSIYHSNQYNNKNMEKTCSICLEAFIIGKKYITLPCFHFFHEQCIDDWFEKSKSCPICKIEIK